MTNEHQYQIGDKVVVITENSEFKKGDICKIAGKDIFGNAYLKRLSDERITYELMSNFKPYEEGGEKKTDMADTKFKVGDRVKVIGKRDNYHCFNIGDIVAITEVYINTHLECADNSGC